MRRLNKPQRTAVEACVDKNVVVIAGAGSGKTRALTHAAAHLVKCGVKPDSILLLTFTNRAAGEMRDRAARLIGTTQTAILASTYHSFGARILRRMGNWIGIDPDFTILDANDTHSVLVATRNHLFPTKRDRDKLPQIAEIAEVLSASCALVKPLTDLVAKKKQWSPGNREACLAICKRYQKHKRTCNQLDFDDLLRYLFVLLGKKKARKVLRDQFQYLLVDEYQDTSVIQARILYRMVGKHNRFMVVGDDSQAIYEWRHAKHTNLFEITERYSNAQLVKLEQNYRSTPQILRVANALQDQMKKQFHKVLWTDNPEGTKPEVYKYLDERSEAAALLHHIWDCQDNGRSLDELAVIYRTNRCPTYLEFELLRNKVPYRKFGGRNFNEAAHVKDIVSHLRVITNPKDKQAMFRALQLCDRVGLKTAEDISNQPGDRLSERIYAYSDNPGVPLKTLQNLLQTLEFTKDPGTAVERAVNYYLSLPVVTRGRQNQTKTAAQQFRVETDCQALIDIASGYKTIRSLVNDLTLNTDSDKNKVKKDTLTLSTVHSCVHPDTFVEDVKGLREIEKVPAHGKIVTAGGVKRYTEKFVYEDSSLLVVKTEGGYELSITPEHRMMSWTGTDYEPVCARNLQIGDFLRLPLSVPSRKNLVKLPPLPGGDVRAREHLVPSKCDVEAAELLGMLVADGTVYQKGFRFHKEYQSSVQKFCSLVHRTFGIEVSPKASTDRNMWYAEVNSARLASWLLKIGGLAPHNKDIPVVICRSPQIVRARFLRGLFEDGTINDQRGVVDHVALTTKFERIARLGQIMLIQLGIISRRFQNDSGHWRLDVSGVHAKTYRDVIGFSCREKQKRLDEGVFRSHAQKHNVPLSWAEAATLKDQSSRQNGKSRGYLSRWIISRDAPHLSDRLKYHHVRIKTIMPSRGPAMCLEVPEGGRFLQNGFDGCNSKGKEWPIVFLMHAYDTRIPKVNRDGEGDIEEELRVAYVAVTRPETRLVVTYPSIIHYYKERLPTRLSRFLLASKKSLFQVYDRASWRP